MIGFFEILGFRYDQISSGFYWTACILIRS